MKNFKIMLVFLLFFIQKAYAFDIENDAVFIRVIDVGAGLATVVHIPDDYYMVYDAGHWTGEGAKAYQGISEVIPERI